MRISFHLDIVQNMLEQFLPFESFKLLANSPWHSISNEMLLKKHSLAELQQGVSSKPQADSFVAFHFIARDWEYHKFPFRSTESWNRILHVSLINYAWWSCFSRAPCDFYYSSEKLFYENLASSAFRNCDPPLLHYVSCNFKCRIRKANAVILFVMSC